jgi:type IV pilus modification protein PilV
MKHLINYPVPTNRLYSQMGIGLIEVLVSIILLSSVLIGAIALQLSTAKEQRSAQFVSRAALLASEMGERMRANRAAVKTGTLYTTDSTYTGAKNNMNSTLIYDCATRICNSTDISDHDISTWWQNIRTQMPADTVGLLLVSTNQPNLSSRDIIIVWREPVVDKDAGGNPNLRPAYAKGCPSSIDAPDGMRCYVQRVML